jgi:hypothetical protein
VEINNKYGFIDKAGTAVVPIIYEGTSWRFSNGVCSVKRGNKWGFVDKTGKEIIEIKYDSVCDFEEGLARIKLNNKWGFVDGTGKEVVPIKYEDIDSFKRGLARFRGHEDKSGYVDRNGREYFEGEMDYSP